jgi:hypothetical protein
VDQNRVRQRVRGLCKFHGIEKVIHLAPVTRLTQVLKHVDQPAVHWAVALCKEVRFDRFIPKVKVPIADALELPHKYQKLIYKISILL